VTTTATLQADPALQVAPVESTGGVLTDAQKALRDGWLASRAK